MVASLQDFSIPGRSVLAWLGLCSVQLVSWQTEFTPRGSMACVLCRSYGVRNRVFQSAVPANRLLDLVLKVVENEMKCCSSVSPLFHAGRYKRAYRICRSRSAQPMCATSLHGVWEHKMSQPSISISMNDHAHVHHSATFFIDPWIRTMHPQDTMVLLYLFSVSHSRGRGVS